MCALVNVHVCLHSLVNNIASVFIWCTYIFVQAMLLRFNIGLFLPVPLPFYAIPGTSVQYVCTLHVVLAGASDNQGLRVCPVKFLGLHHYMESKVFQYTVCA